ncbi:MAG: metallophosphoesterase [Candidatus Marinimicrobia bacterium]|nr:metallophosphoesterase [Candidatus Neomarinimicrobiota bacterium]
MKTQNCIHISDLHGSRLRYESLFKLIRNELPAAVFIGGDILPGLNLDSDIPNDFILDYLGKELQSIQQTLKDRYPRIFIIPGNDDGYMILEKMKLLEKRKLWQEITCRKTLFGNYFVYGYPYIPPSPFLLKDWEKYDVSRYVDPGCTSPETGYYTRTIKPTDTRYSTIKNDLEKLADNVDLENSMFLFHSPPYQTTLDRAALDGKMIDHVPLDMHIGSIAIQRFISERQPKLTLHGHVHESTRLTGSWRDRSGKTHMFNAAHDGPELAVIRFDLTDLESAERVLI